MAFSPDFLAELRARVRVSEIASRKVRDLSVKGGEHVGQSPLTQDGGQTFTSSDARGQWYDFSAGRGGDIFDLLTATEGCSHEEAVGICAGIAGVPLQQSGELAGGGLPGASVQDQEVTGDSNGHAKGNGRSSSNGNGHSQGHADGEAPPLPEELTNERELLGLILCRPDLLKHAEEEVSPDDFICFDHRRMFIVLLDAREHDYAADIKTITAAFTTGTSNSDVFPGFSAGQYVAHLMAGAPMRADDADMGFITRNLARQVREQADIERGVIEPEAEPPAPRKSRYGLVMWSDRNQTGEQYEYLIEDILPVGEAALIVGESQSGKSFFTLDMALALARGTPFFGKRVLQPRGVVYCAYEGGKGFRNRLRAYAVRNGVASDDIPFAVLTKPIDLWSNLINTDELIKEIKWIAETRFNGIPLGAVVIDTHNAATPGASEIDSKEVSVIRERYRKIVAETGAAIWIIGHKNAAGRHRGNEQLYNNIETAIDISVQTTTDKDKVVTKVKDAQGRILRSSRMLKQREGQNDIPLGTFTLPWVGLGTHDLYGKERGSCVIQMVSEDEAALQGEPAAEGIKLNDTDHGILKALVSALAEKGQNTPRSLQLPQSIQKVVAYKEWLEAYRKVATEPSEDAMTKAVQRSGKKLLKLCIIGRDNPYVWLTGRPVKGVISAQPKSIIPGAEMPNGLD